MEKQGACFVQVEKMGLSLRKGKRSEILLSSAELRNHQEMKQNLIWKEGDPTAVVVWSTSRSIEVSATIKFSRALSEKKQKQTGFTRTRREKNTHRDTLPALAVGR